MNCSGNSLEGADTLTDAPCEVPARRGFTVSCRGKTLLSRIDPVAQGERLAAEIPLKERTLYFCPSPLYGYGLALFLGKLKSDPLLKDSAVLCAEADGKLFDIAYNAFGELCRNAAPADEGIRRLVLAKVSDPQSLCAFVRKTWGERRFRRVEVIRLTGGWQLFPQLYADCEQALRREMALEWRNAMTMIHLGRLYARNFIRNLSILPCGENIAALNYSSSPVLVLGAGPSLDPLLDGLSVFCGGSVPQPEGRRFKIICVDTCIPALRERGIKPDLAVILESQHWNLRDFTGARGWDIDAAIDLSALPASGRVLGGRRFFFTTPWTGLALFGRLREAGLLPETFPPLGSVGLSAVAIALRVSSGPVVTGGIDFSYTLDAYHARSTPGHGDLERKQSRLKSMINAGAALRDGVSVLLSKDGKSVRSDPAMRNYWDLFEQEFGGNPRLLDITGPGLPLGVKTVSRAEAFGILNGGSGFPIQAGPSPGASPAGAGTFPGREKTAAFIRRETDTLEALRDMLSGARAMDSFLFEEYLDAADYLWAHFPECAGGGRRPPCTDLSFLKRVRAGTEYFSALWEMAHNALTHISSRSSLL